MSYQDQARKEFNGFMTPEARDGQDLFCMIGEDGIADIKASGLEFSLRGIYIRLSASGYMDCTEWSGPFDDIEAACEHLLDTHGEQ